MKNDFDYIRDKFEEDGIKAPESLSEDRIMEMLPDLDGKTAGDDSKEVVFTRVQAKKKPQRTGLRKAIAIAACAVIAIAGAPGLYNAVMGAPDTSLQGEDLYTFNNYGEIRRLVKDLNDDDSFSFFRLGNSKDAYYEEDTAVDGGDVVYEASNDAAPGAGDSLSKGSPDHSTTYLQVEEVDEADIVKTDGNYIYYVNEKEEVVILEAKDGKTKKVATIGNEGVENYVHDIFLKGDTLVTLGRVYDDDNGYTAIVTYDISDRSKPEFINEYRQTGNIVSGRMVGDFVYLVTSDYVYNGGRIVPKCTIDGAYVDIPASDICCVPEPTSSSYIILGAVDISAGKQTKCKSRAIFGASDLVYCNDHNLYTTSTEWTYEDGTYWNGSARTRIVRASLDGTKIKFNATATVSGYVNDQWAMNERDGYFYIATTGQRDGMDVNNLFVLDKSLKETGKVTGFARDESIRAVRYIADKAYVITYEAIDPLFVIDLSDPAKPHIEGEVKIDGFSTLLVPVSKDTLLGIGYATGDNGYGGEFAAGLKLALFDISDPSEPKVIDSKEFENMNSPAQDTHLALIVNSKEGWYAIPYEIYRYVEPEPLDGDDVIEDDGVTTDIFAEGDSYVENGVLVFSADGKIKVIDQHKLGKDFIYRSVYIDKYIYALNGDGEAASFIPGEK